MLKLIAAATITLVMAPTLATAQTQTQTPTASPATGLVNIIVAKQFCGINPPVDVALEIITDAAAQFGIDERQVVEAGVIAAGEIGRNHQTNGTLANFCIRIAQIYSGVY